MKFLLTLGKTTLAAMAMGATLFTRISVLALLMAGIHGATGPLTRLFRAVLDAVDAALDAAGAWCIQGWASLWNWPGSRTDGAVEAWFSVVDVPEKLGATHVLGLVLEAAMLLAFLPSAIRTEEWSWPRLPVNVWPRQLELWARHLPRYVRVERLAMIGLGLLALPHVGALMRARAVALVSATLLSWDSLRLVGTAAWVFAVLLGARYALLPWLSVPAEVSLRAGRPRRILCLLCLVLSVVALLESAWA